MINFQVSLLGSSPCLWFTIFLSRYFFLETFYYKKSLKIKDFPLFSFFKKIIAYFPNTEENSIEKFFIGKVFVDHEKLFFEFPWSIFSIKVCTELMTFSLENWISSIDLLRIPCIKEALKGYKENNVWQYRVEINKKIII